MTRELEGIYVRFRVLVHVDARLGRVLELENEEQGSQCSLRQGQG